MINELDNKVPTALQYDDFAQKVKSWVFLCELDNPDANVIELFKLHLDPGYKDDPRSNAPSLDEARKWFQDYLRCLHDYVRDTFRDSHPRWQHMRCEFNFSVPTTWSNPGQIANILKIVENAGFGSDGPNHRAKIKLTEAEAAAVYASKQHFRKDDVILVCDAGGGTTDVNVLRLDSFPGQAIQLEQLSWVEGRAIGSALIDVQFHRLLADRLDRIRDYLENDPVTTATHMMQGKFERVKCSHGTDTASKLPEIRLRVPGIRGSSFPNARIEDSMMTIYRPELQELFDVQVDRMLKLIDEQYARIEAQHPKIQISYLILSGGLGSSPYVKKRLKFHFEAGPGSSKPNAQDTKVLTVSEPQLAVVQGLVMDRIQWLSRREVVFKQRCSRNSYGIVYRRLYNDRDPSLILQTVIEDSRDKKKYVHGQVGWFVKQGESVPSEGVMKPFYFVLPPGGTSQDWQCQIVMCKGSRHRLPTNISQDGVIKLCKVTSVLKNAKEHMKAKKRHWWQLRPKYCRLEFDVKMVLGPADIMFQLQTKDNKVFSQGHEEIRVQWEPYDKAFIAGEQPLEGLCSSET